MKMKICDLEFSYTEEEQNKIYELRMLLSVDRELFVGHDDVFLTKFLYSTNWCVMKSVECIRNYYKFKDEHPEWFAKQPVEYFRRHILETKTRFLMPYPDKNGRPIVIIKSLDVFGRFPNYFQDIIEMDDLIFEALLLLPRTQRFGITIIFDLNGMTYNFIRMVSPTFARLINTKISVVPYRHRSVHILQSGIIASTAIALILPFIAQEYKQHIHIHNKQNFEKLHEMLGYENVPAEYDGPETNQFDEHLLYNFLLSNSQYLQRLKTYVELPPS